ncbi:MAG: tetratricopeptide repeat protein [Burkholderiaceae bacterium]|nr:tetratricopeptide repeat protein [Burkholderiaceae bacterium]
MTARPLPLPRLLAALALCAACLVWSAAQAQNSRNTPNDYAQVRQLLQQGQSAQALQQADDYIAANPKDPQMRFIKAAALSETGHADQAEAILLQLTRDYPELAEPYNNLAVLYAGRGELDLARQALQEALRIDPKYATARENLGDVYAALAHRAWQQAQASDPAGKTRLAPKIEALDKLLAPAAAPASSPASAQP